MALRHASAFLLALPLFACAGQPIQPPIGNGPPPSLLPVSDVVNAIKCELGDTFAHGKYLDSLIAQDKDGADITATLDLTDVDVRANSGSAGVSIPFGGVTAGGAASGGTTRSAAQTLEVKFSYDLEKDMAVPDFCATLPVRVKGRPFVTILDGILTEYGKVQPGVPKVKLGTVSYTSEFEVEKTIESGLTVNFLVFSFGATHSNSHAHKQSLTLDFDLGLLPSRLMNQ